MLRNSLGVVGVGLSRLKTPIRGNREFDFPEFCNHSLDATQGMLNGGSYFWIEIVEEVCAGDSHPEGLRGLVHGRNGVCNRNVGAGNVGWVISRDGLEHCRCVSNRACKRADVIERSRKWNDATARHASI